ncbi:hypothetical protein AB751O23_AQ_00170 [Chlamydiales bacterium SCGC AB-751-O23]|jgi:hypothetical protein|nr:hypothetical protein AB751O23_AQ_00170 [Chlamydiales bacterium SCGC AB-751-O23]
MKCLKYIFFSLFFFSFPLYGEEESLTAALITGKDKIYQDKFEYKSDQLKGVFLSYEKKNFGIEGFLTFNHDRERFFSSYLQKNTKINENLFFRLYIGGFFHDLKTKPFRFQSTSLRRKSFFFGPLLGNEFKINLPFKSSLLLKTQFHKLYAKHKQTSQSHLERKQKQSSGFLYQIKINKKISNDDEVFFSYLFDATRTKIFWGSRSSYFLIGVKTSF